MRAVTGSLTSSEPVSLRRAAGILSTFAKSSTGARPEIAANVRRSSKAFDELLHFHREIRGNYKGSRIQIQEQEKNTKEVDAARIKSPVEPRENYLVYSGNEDRDRKRKKKKLKVEVERKEKEFPIPTKAVRIKSAAGEAGNGGVLGIDENRDSKRKKKTVMKAEEEEKGIPIPTEAERTKSPAGDVENGQLLGSNEDRDWKRKGKMAKEADEDEKESLERNSEEGKKRKEEAKEVGRPLDKESKDGDRKKRKHSLVEDGGASEDQSERKQKKRIMGREG